MENLKIFLTASVLIKESSSLELNMKEIREREERKKILEKFTTKNDLKNNESKQGAV